MVQAMWHIPRQHDGNAAGGQRPSSPLSSHRPANVLPGARKTLTGRHAGLYVRRPYSSPIKACGASQLGWEDGTWIEIAASHSPLMTTRDRRGNARR